MLSSAKNLTMGIDNVASCIRQAEYCLSEDASKTYRRSSPVAWTTATLSSLIVGISEGLMNRLQSVENAVASLVTDTRRSDHITPVLRQIHWLIVQ